MLRLSILSLIAFFACKVIGQVEVGKPAPEVVITHLLSNSDVYQDMQGKNKVLEFWATWCAPCIKAIPHMNEMQRSFKGENVEFISLTNENPDKVQPKLPRYGFESIVAVDTSQITFRGFGGENGEVSLFPLCVLIDVNNIVRWAGHPNDLNNDKMELFLHKKYEDLANYPDLMKIKRERFGPPEFDSLFIKFMVDTSGDFFLMKPSDLIFSSTAVYPHLMYSVNVDLQSLYLDLFGLGKNDILISPSLAQKKYSVLLKGKYRDGNNRELINTKICEINNLEIKDTLVTSMYYHVFVSDSTKLDKAKNSKFSSVSQENDLLVLEGQSFGSMVELLNTKTTYKFVDRAKMDGAFDFTLKLEGIDKIISQLGTYGIQVKKYQETRKILSFREMAE